jgi:hypothetical protein
VIAVPASISQELTWSAWTPTAVGVGTATPEAKTWP